MQRFKQHCFVAEKACKAKSPAEVSSKAVTAELGHQPSRTAPNKCHTGEGEYTYPTACLEQEQTAWYSDKSV